MDLLTQVERFDSRNQLTLWNEKEELVVELFETRSRGDRTKDGIAAKIKNIFIVAAVEDYGRQLRTFRVKDGELIAVDPAIIAGENQGALEALKEKYQHLNFSDRYVGDVVAETVGDLTLATPVATCERIVEAYAAGFAKKYKGELLVAKKTTSSIAYLFRVGSLSAGVVGTVDKPCGYYRVYVRYPHLTGEKAGQQTARIDIRIAD